MLPEQLKLFAREANRTALTRNDGTARCEKHCMELAGALDLSERGDFSARVDRFAYSQ
jgi:hypothetical protein